MEVPSNNMLQSIEGKIAFIQRMGLQVVEIRKGYAKLYAPLAGNENHIGIMYAGAIFSLAEFLGGVFCWSSFNQDKFFPIVKQMSINYVKPVKTDAYVEVRISEEEICRIENEAEQNGKSEFELGVEIKDLSGKTVATTSGVYQLRAGMKE